MQKIGNPVPLFLDARGLLLDGGYIYVGVADGDPETDPVDVFADKDLTIPLEQPLRTIGGFIVNITTPTSVFIAEDDYSMRIKDNLGALVDYSPSVYSDTAAFQPASTILDALVSNGMPTTYGLSLLKLANYAAFKAANSIPDFLQLTGGTMTGYATHQGAGVEPFWADPAMVSGKMAVTDAGDADPTAGPGDIWLKRA